MKELINRIAVGDARLLAAAIPDNGIDLILTDPVYQNAADYEWLAQLAVRVLKPTGLLLAYCGTKYKGMAITALEAGGCRYTWDLIIKSSGRRTPVFGLRVQATQVSCLIAIPDGSQADLRWTQDLIVGGTRSDHNWGKGMLETLAIIERFSKRGDVVLDPFSGSGTVPAACVRLGRRFVGFESDQGTARQAQERLGGLIREKKRSPGTRQPGVNDLSPAQREVYDLLPDAEARQKYLLTLPAIRVNGRVRQTRLAALGRAAERLDAIAVAIKARQKEIAQAQSALRQGGDPHDVDLEMLLAPPELPGARLLWTRAKRPRRPE